MDFFFVLLLSEITCLSIISLVIFLKWIICSFGYEYCFVFWQIPSETLPGSSERSVTLAGSPDALGSCVAKICDIFEEVSLVFCLFVCLFVLLHDLVIQFHNIQSLFSNFISYLFDSLIFPDFYNQIWWTSLHKKWSFPLKIFSLNVTKSVVSYGFGHVYWRNP